MMNKTYEEYIKIPKDVIEEKIKRNVLDMIPYKLWEKLKLEEIEKKIPKKYYEQWNMLVQLIFDIEEYIYFSGVYESKGLITVIEASETNEECQIRATTALANICSFFQGDENRYFYLSEQEKEKMLKESEV